MIHLAQLPQPSMSQFWGFLISAVAIAGIILLLYRIRNERAKANQVGPEQRRILPSPMVTREEDPPVPFSAFHAQNKKRDQELKEMETRLEKRIDNHELVVRGRLHEISGELGNVALEAKNGREIATEQFQNIEGRLGELKATTEHTNALAIRTDQRVQKMAEDLPDKIANAVNRGRRT